MDANLDSLHVFGFNLKILNKITQKINKILDVFCLVFSFIYITVLVHFQKKAVSGAKYPFKRYLYVHFTFRY